MDRLSKLNVDQLGQWLKDQNVPADVTKMFEEHEMDGESLVTLIGITPGPDCLKDLIPKIGLRLKVYRCIKACYDEETNKELTQTECFGDTCSIASTSIKETLSSQSTDEDIKKLQKEVLALKKEKVDLQAEIEKHSGSHNYKESVAGSSSSSSSGEPSKIKKTRPCKAAKSQSNILPNPFPIPCFRRDTEDRLKKKILTDGDRKYMVQTLATMIMSHKIKPSMDDCLSVSRVLHTKFRFLGDESSEDSWKWFLYTRTQNVNKKSNESESPPKKKCKVECMRKHKYPEIPLSADDDVSVERNLQLLKEESSKPKPCHESIKTLMARTHAARRVALLDSQYSTVSSFIQEYPVLKRCTYVKLEFELIMQRPNLKNEFDEALILWAKAVVAYCKKTCVKSVTIQTLVKDVNIEYDGQILLKALRCLSLLLIPGKSKPLEGDIPYFMKFVSNDTPPSQAAEVGNSQPHIVIFNHDEYDQFFIAIEQKLYMECADLAMAIYLMLGAHYVFNLSYHPRIYDLLKFIQEKVADIPSDEKGKKSKSPLAASHISGILSTYHSLKTAEDQETLDTLEIGSESDD